MSTTYSLSLTRINYRGANIGDDFQIVLTVAGKPPVSLDLKIRNGSDRVFSPPKAILKEQTHTGTLPITIPLTSEITEVDTREEFNDRGKSTDNLVTPAITGNYVARVIALVHGDARGDKGRRAFLDLEFNLQVVTEEEEIPPGEALKVPTEILTEEQGGGKIYAFVSDVHIGDGTLTDDFNKFDDGSFIQMLNWLKALASARKVPLCLVLLGDFLEIWEAKARITVNGIPRNHFVGDDPGDTKIAIAKAKVTKIVKAHPTLFTELKKFSAAHDLAVVVGNHDDDLLNLQVLNHFKSESKVETFKFFTGAIAFPEYAIWAEHGHKFDSFNFGGNFGSIPDGRLVVEQISTFLEEAETLQLLTTQTIRRPKVRNPFNQFDSVAKFSDYIKCLELKGYIMPYDQIIREISRRIDELIKGLDVDRPQTDPQYLQRASNFLQMGLIDAVSGSGRQNPLDRVKFILGILEGRRGDNAPNKANALSRTGPQKQCILMGHNHTPEMSVIGEDQRYINTGNWQDSGTSDPGSPDCFKLGPHRHVTLVYRSPERARPTRIRADMFTFPGANRIQSIFYEVK